MSQHEINPDSERYHPYKLERKEYIGIGEFLSLDMRIGTIVKVLQFPEMRKPSYKIKVDFGEKIGRLWTSAQITNYSRGELLGKSNVAAINLGEKTLPTGFISEFLILGALKPDGTVSLIEVKEKLLPGSVIS